MPPSGHTLLDLAVRTLFIWQRGYLILDDTVIPKPFATAMEGLALGAVVYAPAFMRGSHPARCPHIGPVHPELPYNGLHPYVFMLGVWYFARAILMIRGAKDPKADVFLFDYGILANLLHVLVMISQAFIYPNEHAHLGADVPLLLAVSAILGIWHPNRVAPETSRTW